MDSLDAAFERHDLATLKRESHALKGACLEFGMVRMGKQCDELRNCTEDEAYDLTPELLRNLRREFNRIQPVLEAEKAGEVLAASVTGLSQGQ